MNTQQARSEAQTRWITPLEWTPIAETWRATPADAAPAPVPTSGFQAGDKIICTRAGNLSRRYVPAIPLVEGAVYCVREAYDDGVPGVLVCGVRCLWHTPDGEEGGFRQDRFKLVHRCGGAT